MGPVTKSKRRSRRLEKLETTDTVEASTENKSGRKPIHTKGSNRANRTESKINGRKRATLDEPEENEANETSSPALVSLNTVSPVAKRAKRTDCKFISSKSADKIKGVPLKGHQTKARKKLYTSCLSFFDERRVCTCDDNHCSRHSLTHVYIDTYGEDYSEHLKQWEFTYFGAKASSSTCAESLSPDYPGDMMNPSTPSNRVAYVSRTVDDHTISENSDSTTPSKSLANNPHITDRMREVLVDWMIEVSAEFKLSEATIHLAVELVDRSLESCGENDDDSVPPSPGSQDSNSATSKLFVKREYLQCLGCACMWIASKIEEISPPSVGDFVFISADSYSKSEIKEMEMEVCAALKFRLWRVTSHHFVDEFVHISKRRPGCRGADLDSYRYLVSYLLELAMLSLDLVSVLPSLKCAAAVFLARTILGMVDSETRSPWSTQLTTHTGYDATDIERVVLTLHSIHLKAEESKLKNVFLKYSDEKRCCVSHKTVPLIDELIF